MREKPAEICESRAERAFPSPARSGSWPEALAALCHSLLHCSGAPSCRITMTPSLWIFPFPLRKLCRELQDETEHNTRSEEGKNRNFQHTCCVAQNPWSLQNLNGWQQEYQSHFYFPFLNCALYGEATVWPTLRNKGCAPPLWGKSISIKYLGLFCMEDLSVTLIYLLTQSMVSLYYYGLADICFIFWVTIQYYITHFVAQIALG